MAIKANNKFKYRCKVQGRVLDNFVFFWLLQTARFGKGTSNPRAAQVSDVELQT